MKDLKILKVDFMDSLGCRLPDWTRSGYCLQRYLKPLKKCRAQKVSMDTVRGCTTGLKLINIVAPHQCVHILPFAFSLSSGIESRDRGP